MTERLSHTHTYPAMKVLMYAERLGYQEKTFSVPGLSPPTSLVAQMVKK